MSRKNGDRWVCPVCGASIQFSHRFRHACRELSRLGFTPQPPIYSNARLQKYVVRIDGFRLDPVEALEYVSSHPRYRRKVLLAYRFYEWLYGYIKSLGLNGNGNIVYVRKADILRKFTQREYQIILQYASRLEGYRHTTRRSIVFDRKLVTRHLKRLLRR